MRKFKLGDRVIVDYSKSGIYSHVKDEAGTIVLVDYSTYLVKCDNEIGTFSDVFIGGFKSNKKDLIWVEDKHLTLIEL